MTSNGQRLRRSRWGFTLRTANQIYWFRTRFLFAGTIRAMDGEKSRIGVYKSGGFYTGPFVELVERCEELLSPNLKPPSANARGIRVARAIGVDKKAKPS